MWMPNAKTAERVLCLQIMNATYLNILLFACHFWKQHSYRLLYDAMTQVGMNEPVDGVQGEMGSSWAILLNV